MRRDTQVPVGIYLLVVGGLVLVLPLVLLERMPSGVFLWGGLLALGVGAWLVAPVGMFGIWEKVQGSVPLLHDHEGDDA